MRFGGLHTSSTVNNWGSYASRPSTAGRRWSPRQCQWPLIRRNGRWWSTLGERPPRLCCSALRPRPMRSSSASAREVWRTFMCYRRSAQGLLTWHEGWITYCDGRGWVAAGDLSELFVRLHAAAIGRSSSRLGSKGRRRARDHEPVDRGDGCLVPQELRQVGEGALRPQGRYRPTVAWLTSMPSLSSSLWMRGAPQGGLAPLIQRIRATGWASGTA